MPSTSQGYLEVRRRLKLTQRRAKWKARYLNAPNLESDELSRGVLLGERLLRDGESLGMRGWWMERLRREVKLVLIKQLRGSGKGE